MKEGSYLDIKTTSFERFAAKDVIPFFIIATLYTFWVKFALGGIRGDHYLFIIGVSILYFLGATTRKMIWAFGFILIYWFIFDS
ncbi:MAG: hypothetical protein AAF573_18650, partial [Bacteroidota bacterium]